MLYQTLEGKKLILFDGICNLCNKTIQKIIRFDKKKSFIFASLQSETGKKIVTHLKIDTTKIDSIILYENSTQYTIKSTAVLKIMNDFGGIWKLTFLFWVIPKFIRDIFYDFIAKNRYKWFGKSEKCLLPSLELKKRFLE